MKLILRNICIPLCAVVVMTLTFTTANAFDWNIKNGDQRVTGKQVKSMVFGKIVKFKDGSKEHYKANGTYVFQDNSKTYPPVDYKFFKDGKRCMYFDGGGRRCDMYVMNNGKLVLINAQGKRYPTTVR